jgi:UDP-arabinose 4-epimerase
MKRVLVTGGAGYVGSHACKAMAACGVTPVVVDDLSRGHRGDVRFGPFHEGDFGDPELLDRVFAEHDIDGVMHFAAFAYVGESMADPGSYYRNNVAKTLTLLQAMVEHGCRDVVFSSSCAVYGAPECLPLTEDAPQRPVSPYGWSKFMVERMLEDFASAHGLRFASLRYFNAAGADPEGELGEKHDPETHLIPLVLAAALDSERVVDVFGTDYDTPDGTCVRDFVHVADLARAHLLALDHAANKGGGVFNLGVGRGYSVRQVLDAAERVTGRPIAWRGRSRRPGDPSELFADSGRARRELGWRPEFRDLETIIGHAWQWAAAGGKQ